jgi:hypothetical protein
VPPISGVPRQPPRPRKIHTIKVRGKDVKLTTDELLDRASKVEAADSYLEESRTSSSRRNRFGRRACWPGPSTPRGPKKGARRRSGCQPTINQPPPPGLDLKSVVEKIQFGDPEEAAADLAKAIDHCDRQKVNEGHVRPAGRNDLARAKADLKAFRDANPELAKDELASKTIENLIYSIYREEIQKLGVDEAQIPKDPKQPCRLASALSRSRARSFQDRRCP